MNLPDGHDRRRVFPISLKSSKLKFSCVGFHYEGEVNADGDSIEGFRTIVHTRPLRFERATEETAWPFCTSTHSVRFIEVDEDVELEVLDWGGTGRPLLLLTGLGSTAHTFDNFAPRLTGKYHVYGITRRGFGESSFPIPDDTHYAPDRLGDDVLAVMDALRLNRSVLAGASVAGEEMSSIGSRFPEKVAGLIYLDAGLSFAYYDNSRGDLHIDAHELRRKLEEQLTVTSSPRELKPLVRDLLQVHLPGIEKHLRKMDAVLDALPDQERRAEVRTEGEAPLERRQPAWSGAARAIMASAQKYTAINCPVLSIFADRSDFSPMHKDDPAARAAAEAIYVPRKRAQMDAFEAGIPQARVVRLANADHAVYRSNLEDVVREIDEFVARLT